MTLLVSFGSKIHCLTKEGSNTLRVDLGDFEGNTAYANYCTFNVSDDNTEYLYTNSRRIHWMVLLGIVWTIIVEGDSVQEIMIMITGQELTVLRSTPVPGSIVIMTAFVQISMVVICNTAINNYYQGIVWYYWKYAFITLKFSEMKTVPTHITLLTLC